MEKEKVIVTGFGPFGDHKINASWEAVKLLPSHINESINLIVEEIPVTYNDVESIIKDLWTIHNPKLVIHVGVSSLAQFITIERQANRCGYIKTDCLGNVHPTGVACPDHEGTDTILCQIDVEQVCKYVNDTYNKPVLCSSNNAGRYLCEYIFYKSLRIDNSRTMFVHVPPLDKPFSAQELAEALMLIIEACLLQLNCICIGN